MLRGQQLFYEKGKIGNCDFLHIDIAAIDLTIQALKPKNHTTQVHSSF